MPPRTWHCIIHGQAEDEAGLLTVYPSAVILLQGILRNLKYALVWGSSTKHRPQKVSSMPHTQRGCYHTLVSNFFS